MPNKCALIFSVLVLLVLLIFCANFIFLSKLNSQINNSSKLKTASQKSLNNDVINSFNKFEDVANNQRSIKSYSSVNPTFHLIRNSITKSFQNCDHNPKNFSEIWEVANWWTNQSRNNEVYPQYDSYLCKVICALQNVPIINAKNTPKGTQLKLNLEIEGNNQVVIFKPSWYNRTRIIDGPIYSGKDRHNSEIAAFYLGAILNLRWTPIAVGRKINLESIFKIGDTTLQETMILKENETKLCLFGKCFYCKPSELVCGDKNHWIEGVLLYLIPGPISKIKSPWQRTYKENHKAIWEDNDNKYCDYVQTKLSKTRLLDLIDVSIFDYLIQNGDRHHYETKNNRVLLLDNGKGFGNPNVDVIDILAPLYQCCMIRNTTWNRLQVFTGGSLSKLHKLLASGDSLYPILTDQHYVALERRYLKVFAIVDYCKVKFGSSIFK